MGGAASHGQVTQEEKLTWQSPAATVSVSLPRVGGGGGGSQQTSPTSRFSTTLHSCAFCTSSKTGESKIRWSFHTLSHKDQGVKKKREDGRPSHSCPIHNGPGKRGAQFPHSCWSIQESKRSPEMLKDKSGPQPCQARRWRERSPSWAECLSPSPTVTDASPRMLTHVISPTGDKILTPRCSCSPIVKEERMRPV